MSLLIAPTVCSSVAIASVLRCCASASGRVRNWPVATSSTVAMSSVPMMLPSAMASEMPIAARIGDLGALRVEDITPSPVESLDCDFNSGRLSKILTLTKCVVSTYAGMPAFAAASDCANAKRREAAVSPLHGMVETYRPTTRPRDVTTTQRPS